MLLERTPHRPGSLLGKRHLVRDYFYPFQNQQEGTLTPHLFGHQSPFLFLQPSLIQNNFIS